MTEKLKKYETISACGIDCGLCPRFYTKGDSVCPGCGGVNFREKRGSCGVLTCCVIKKGFETCADCKEFPCRRFETVSCGSDSFVTHKKIIGISAYIAVFNFLLFNLLASVSTILFISKSKIDPINARLLYLK